MKGKVYILEFGMAALADLVRNTRAMRALGMEVARLSGRYL